MFNNAGVNQPQHFLEITEEVYSRIMDVNALGVLLAPRRPQSRWCLRGAAARS